MRKRTAISLLICLSLWLVPPTCFADKSYSEQVHERDIANTYATAVYVLAGAIVVAGVAVGLGLRSRKKA